jgi:hypothetical protein
LEGFGTKVDLSDEGMAFGIYTPFLPNHYYCLYLSISSVSRYYKERKERESVDLDMDFVFGQGSPHVCVCILSLSLCLWLDGGCRYENEI